MKKHAILILVSNLLGVIAQELDSVRNAILYSSSSNSTQLYHSQIKEIRDNYINNRLHQYSPLHKSWYGKKHWRDEKTYILYDRSIPVVFMLHKE